MFCRYCGKQIEDDSAFCKFCGKPLRANQTQDSPPSLNPSESKDKLKPDESDFNSFPINYVPVHDQKDEYSSKSPQTKSTDFSSNASVTNKVTLFTRIRDYFIKDPTEKLIWHKMNIYAFLFISGGMDILAAFQVFLGTQYRGRAKEVYAYYSELEVLDVFYGIICIVLGIFCFVVRSKLSAFKQNAPKRLIALYVCTVIAIVLYNVIGVSIIGASLSSVLPTLLGTVLGYGIRLVIDSIYYHKRRALFVQ